MWGKERVHEPEINCSLTKPPTIFLEAVSRQKISLLMDEYKNQEWLAYLIGRISEKGSIFAEDISVPPHAEASGASAEAEPFHIPKDCVGVIHSHHNMGAFHSGTDQSYVDKNFPVSITVARNRENGLIFDAVSYQQTPCGKNMTLKCSVKYVQPKPLFDTGKFIEEAKENIDKNKRAYKSLVVPNSWSEDKDIHIQESSYVPIRHRLNDLGTKKNPVITDRSGRVLTKTEVDDIMANSSEG